MPDTVNLLLYADDSAILVSGKDTVYIEETLSKELHFVTYRLGKTESIREKLNRFCLETV
jgi:ppGpp synthetase/RelA/SpoT-type nucleotidyltranferase